MSPEKADYSEIAEVYDQARTGDAPHLEWWFQKIIQVGGLRLGGRLIDLGCGTGRWAIPLAERTGCQVVGLDRSPEMLEKARAKDREGRVTWVAGDVEHLELEPSSFDCAFLCLMMHHIEDHLGTFRGVLRILRPGGVILVRQGTLEQIVDDPWHRFFPEAVTIDRRRTPFRAEIETWLREAGFMQIEAEEVRQFTYRDLADLNERMLGEVRLRVASVLRLISDAAFARGLAQLEAYVRQHPDDPWLKESLFTLFTARKRHER
jgi:ubiquinone/menaquinone biosynthesis C-methylase UbiE